MNFTEEEKIGIFKTMNFTEEEKIGIFYRLGLSPSPTFLNVKDSYRYQLDEDVYIEHMWLEAGRNAAPEGHYYRFNIESERHFSTSYYHIHYLPSVILELHHLGYLQYIDFDLYNTYIEDIYGEKL